MSSSGYLLIADISGYTEFVKLHNMRKTPVIGNALANNFEYHAETIIADLLEVVIEAIEPTLSLNKLEGDAAFFFSEDKKDKLQSDEIIQAMEKANEAFKAKASELVFVQACGCEPCLQSKNLKLKIVAHKGNFTIKKIRNFEELAGEDVILTHRMLKNSLLSNEYWLVTNNFFENLSENNKKMFVKITEDLDDFEKISLNYREFSTPDPINEKFQNRSRIQNWLTQAKYFMTSKKRTKQNN